MWIVKLAWKNLWRNKQRTAITMASIFFAVLLSIFASSLRAGIFENLIKNMVGFYSGYIQIHQKGYWKEQIIDNCFTRNNSLELEISKIKNIKAITPRLESFALVSTGTDTKGCLIVGLDPELENNVTNFQQMLINGSYIKEGDQDIILSEGLLKRLKVRLYDTIMVIGQGFHGENAAGKYKIIGIVKPGSPALNDQLMIMPLKKAQELLSATGKSSTYAIGIHDQKNLVETARNLSTLTGSAYEVMTWEEMMPDVTQHIRNDTRNMQIVQGILYLLICFGIFSTLVMMLAERTFEMGMLISIGMHKGMLALTIMIESLMSVILGCFIGLLFSIPIVYFLKIHPIRLKGNIAKAFERFGFEAIFPTSTNPEIFLNQVLIVLFIGILLSAYVFVKVIRLNPVEAIRK